MGTTVYLFDGKGKSITRVKADDLEHREVIALMERYDCCTAQVIPPVLPREDETAHNGFGGA